MKRFLLALALLLCTATTLPDEVMQSSPYDYCTAICRANGGSPAECARRCFGL